jgi:hypothetical protein
MCERNQKILTAFLNKAVHLLFPVVVIGLQPNGRQTADNLVLF